MIVAALVLNPQPVLMTGDRRSFFIVNPCCVESQINIAVIGSPALCASEPAIDDVAKS